LPEPEGKLFEKIGEQVESFKTEKKKLQKLLKSKREIVKSFKTFLGNCDILKNSPNSVEKFSYRLKNVPKDYG
jgi:hypothetical protein